VSTTVFGKNLFDEPKLLPVFRRLIVNSASSSPHRSPRAPTSSASPLHSSSAAQVEEEATCEWPSERNAGAAEKDEAKPFECVGTAEEALLSLWLARERVKNSGGGVPFALASLDVDRGSKLTSLLQGHESRHLLPHWLVPAEREGLGRCDASPDESFLSSSLERDSPPDVPGRLSGGDGETPLPASSPPPAPAEAVREREEEVHALPGCDDKWRWFWGSVCRIEGIKEPPAPE